MRQFLPTIAFTGLLAGCANVHERPFVTGSMGFGANEVVGAERADIEAASVDSRVRREISAIDGVDGLRCVTLKQIGADTPRCDYRLRYRRPDGTSATKMRRKRFFQRDHDGRWMSVIIV